MGYRLGKLLSPERRRVAVDHAQEQGLSERKACRLVNQPRGTQRYLPTQREDEDALHPVLADMPAVVLKGRQATFERILENAPPDVHRSPVEGISPHPLQP